MFHIHINATYLKFIKHLPKPLFFRLLSFGAINPSNIIILLIRWTLPIKLH